MVLEFDGKPVKDARHLKLEVAEARPGESVPVKYLRDGHTETVQVKLKAAPGTETLAKAEGSDSGDNGTLNGVTVADLDRAARQQLNTPESLKGAVITQVQPDPAAAEARGLET